MTAPSLSAATQCYAMELVARYPQLESCREVLCRAVQAICHSHRAGGKVLICGNGGSAADADHIVGELVKSFVHPRHISEEHRIRLEQAGMAPQLATKLQRGVSALSLSSHATLSTAICNDTEADMVFAQQVYVYGQPQDTLIAISTSGNSRNVLAALQVGRAFGLGTIGLTGSRGGQMVQWCDILFKAPAQETFHIQELHLPFYHALCLMVECELFGN